MKKILIITSALIMSVSVWAQSPEKMNFQSVIRDGGNALVKTQAVGIQVSIIQSTASGTAVYVETHTPTTNINGLVSLEIGTGTVVSGEFASINWASDVYFVKIETDLDGGTNYTITGVSQLMSVPYALHSKTAESITGEIIEVDGSITNEIQDISSVLTEGNDAETKSIMNLGSLTIGSSSLTEDAALDINVSNGALVLPRLSTAQQDALIASEGMMIFNVDEQAFKGYVSGERIDINIWVYEGWTINNISVGQSFKASSTGQITAFGNNLLSYSGATLKVYSGEGMSGPVIYTEEIPGYYMGENKVVLSVPIDVVAGETYTVDFGHGNYQASYGNSNPYPDGNMYINQVEHEGIDIMFKVYMNGDGWVRLHD